MSKYKYPYRISFFRFLLNSSEVSKNPIPFHYRFFEKAKSNSFSIQPFFSKRILLTRDAIFARHVLQKEHKKYEKSKLQTQFLSKYIGYGLLTASGAYWLQQRRLIQPAFHKKKIEGLLKTIDETIKTELKQIPLNTFQSLYSLMNVLAFEVIAKSLFNFSAEKEDLQQLRNNVEALQRFIVKDIRQPHKRFWYRLKGDFKTNMKLVKESRVIINTIIEKRKISKEVHDDLLDMLLNVTYEDGSKMTNEQLIDEILILFVAGHETTANALTFTLCLLANNTKPLLKAREEAIAFNEDIITMESFSRLPYIKNCIEESMRLYPPAWITDRVALEDDTFNDYHIKKGTLIGVSIYEIHRNKTYWDNPELFFPERFKKENKKETAAYYMPFGAGPRLCIGNNFAVFEMILTVQTLLKNFNIQTRKDTIEISPLITLKPIGVEMKFAKIYRD